jgi:hypothetical protein
MGIGFKVPSSVFNFAYNLTDFVIILFALRSGHLPKQAPSSLIANILLGAFGSWARLFVLGCVQVSVIVLPIDHWRLNSIAHACILSWVTLGDFRVAMRLTSAKLCIQNKQGADGVSSASLLWALMGLPNLDHLLASCHTNLAVFPVLNRSASLC